MAVTQRLELRQGQSLVMTPQLQQAIKLLQLSNIELAGFVERELELNPLLERADGRANVEGFDTGAQPRDHTAENASNRAEDGGFEASDGEAWDAAPAAFDDWGGGGARDFSDPMADRLERTGAQPSLHSFLSQQIDVLLPRGQRRLARTLLGYLDENGYLRLPEGEERKRLEDEPEVLEETIARLQGLEPTGVFARSLEECLSLQLAERDRLDPAMQALLVNLGLLAAGKHGRLKRLCGVDDDDLAEMLAEIRALDPKPGQTFSAGEPATVIPDVILRRHGEKGWIVELNAETLPRVLVNERYYAEVSAAAGQDRAARSYLSERMQSANWLVRALDQRANTILKVASEIVRRQDGFFRRGVGELRPLTLREVAEAVGLHESTVSRVTSNKYLLSPRGTLEFKYFFTAAIAGSDGGAHSAEAVRHRIKRLIEQEKPSAVLSDDRIVEILRGEGIDIARRTVAKYREALRIPSSVRRRREKALQA